MGGASNGTALKPLQLMQYQVLKATLSLDIPIESMLDLTVYHCCHLTKFNLYPFVILFINPLKETIMCFVFLCVFIRLDKMLVDVSVSPLLFLCKHQYQSESPGLGGTTLYLLI